MFINGRGSYILGVVGVDERRWRIHLDDYLTTGYLFKYHQYICKSDDIYKKILLCINEYKILETELSFFVR